MKRSIWIVCSLLVLAGVWFWWPTGGKTTPTPSSKPVTPPTAAALTAKLAAKAAPALAASTSPSMTAIHDVTGTNEITRSAASTNRVFFRLTNTTKTLDEMTRSPHAILLENALVDTAAGMDLKIPSQLRSKDGDPGAYIVQANGTVNGAFRALLAGAGATIVSYIPNNAYLVQLTSGGASALSGNPSVQAVLPYEPYFKVQSSLLGLAVDNKDLPGGQVLTLGLFADGADATVAEIKKTGAKILATDRSPFGPMVQVLPQSNDWLPLAQLHGVGWMYPASKRVLANDLARVSMGISTDTVTNANWLGLSGSNVLVEVSDTGIDPGHDDFTQNGSAMNGPSGPTRVTGYDAESLVDTDGHGTHVAGIIAGNGADSYTVTNVPRGSVTNADFRGKAPAARLYSYGFLGANDTKFYSDEILQSIPALESALISNNSWVYGSSEYDLSAASFDAAVRDALPYTNGPQPVLFVFPAGNDGGGDDDGGGGTADTIMSPGTAKNVITVGSLEQYRDLTNTYTPLNSTNEVLAWQGVTSSSSDVAYYSARGNVGIQTEGEYGRFKPDVVAPGTFVVSTRPSMWDEAAFYNPTNYHTQFSQLGAVAAPGVPAYGGGTIPSNAVALNIRIESNPLSLSPFPTNFPIYMALSGLPSATNYDVGTSNNVLNIPPGGGALSSIDSLRGNTFLCAVDDPTNSIINFDMIITIVTTNDDGNLLTVYSNLNETVGPNYYYDSGTSMAAAAVSGSAALLQDFFTNTLHTTPSPALLKAMLINGARLTSGYNEFAVTNSINWEGWGEVNVPNSVPMGLTNTAALSTNTPMFFVDQSLTNALATGDSRTYNVTVPTAEARSQLMRITLAWTDPPGNPAASIKLVNNLDLIVTNNATGAVYYGNHFDSGATPFSTVVDTNTQPDDINNVENIWIPPSLGTNYSVTVFARNVAVNAVTTEQTNIAQDFALVISCGDGMNTNGIQVTSSTASSSIFTNVTYISSYTNGIYFDQVSGANAPLLSTNDLAIDPADMVGANAALFIGQTNQWHFYVVTNTTTYTNAAFITFIPNTLATPRMGVFSYTTDNSTRPEADLNMFAASDVDPNANNLINLDTTVISNCVYNVNDAQASLGRGGTKFIAYTNSAGGRVYYIGVQCQDQTAAQYGFVAIFSEQPFSQMQNGNQVVNGLLLPANIPDGNNAHPGLAYIFGLALYSMDIGAVTVTNSITHENLGDLVGAVSHGTRSVVLNNHNGEGESVINYTTVYNDDGLPGTTHTDGPGSLSDFRRQEAVGPWILNEVDDSATATGAVTGFSLVIRPHKNLTDGLLVAVPPHSWDYEYIDVPVGYTNLTIYATNQTETYSPGTPIGDVDMYLNFKVEPDFSNYLSMVSITNGDPTAPYGIISYGPPMEPGTYFVGLYNNSDDTQYIYLFATLAFDPNAISKVNFSSDGPVPVVDDAVMNNSILVTNDDTIQGINIGLRVDHPRISDLSFTLISPDGTRYLLMENRGGQTTNGCGATVVTTNTFSGSASGGPGGATNTYNLQSISGSVAVSWDFYQVPDQMDIYSGTSVDTNNIIMTTGLVSGQGTTNITVPASGYITVVMDATNHPSGTLWTYIIGGVYTNYEYLTFTEDTNLTTTPIKYAIPPLVPAPASQVWSDNFDTYPDQTYAAPSTFGAWSVLANQVAIVTNPPAYSPDNSLALENGVVSYILPTIKGRSYLLSYEAGSSLSEDAAGSTNAGWHLTSQSFTATQDNAPLVLDGSGGNLAANTVLDTEFGTNALFDDFSLLEEPGDIYYQPEQSLEPLIGTSARGEWQLEVLDNRTGATNNASLLSWQLQFTFANTNIIAPVLTQPATNVTTTNATLSALVYTGGDTNSYLYFEYGTNLAYGSTSDLTLITNSSSQQLWFTDVTNLIPDTLYHFQAILTNSSGVYYGGDLTFFTHIGPPPYAATLSPTMITGASAQLNGMATPNDLPSVAWFEWGTNMSYGNMTVPVDVGSSNNVVYTNSIITGLLLHTPYHYRLVVSNAFAVTYGFDQVIDEANVLAWGANYLGQLNVPASLTNAVAIAGAYDHNLAIVTNGLVVGWGDNTFGQSTIPSYVGSNVVAAAGGQYYSMVLDTNGAVMSWGANLLNQTNVPVGLSNVVSIAGGVYSSLALESDGSVVAWGATFFGLTNVPPEATNIVAVSSGIYHNLALKNDGTVIAWGDNSAGQTNIPAGLSNVVAIAAGGYHNLALRDDGSVVAWGDDSIGQTNIPVNLTNVVAIAAGGFHNLALQADGKLVMWGDDSSGQTTLPTGLTNIVSIAAGYLHSLVLTPQYLINSTNVTVKDITAGTPETNNILPGSITYYTVNVPTNADFATNTLIFAQNGPLNIWYSTNTPSILSPTNATELMSGVTNFTQYVLRTNATPTLVPGSTYYLGVQNTNKFTVNYAVSVDFHLTSSNSISPISGFTITATNSGFLLMWHAPSNDLFQVQCTTNLAPAVWLTFTNIVGFDTNFPASLSDATFTFFDDGSQIPFGPTRFYRLILLQETNAITLPVQTNFTVSAGTVITVTNTATDSNVGATVSYTLINPPTGASIDNNGVITWSSAGSAGLAAQFNTVATDDATPPASATNSFTVFVTPLPSISNVVVTATDTTLSWNAPTNDQFQVRWTTNLVPPVTWTFVPNDTTPATITSTTSVFTYTDTNAPTAMKFYQLILLP